MSGIRRHTPARQRPCGTCGALQPLSGAPRIRDGKIACYGCVPLVGDRRRLPRSTPRAVSTPTKRLTLELLASQAALLDEDDFAALADRPKTWGECREATGPCPWVSCRHHLYLDVTDVGSIKINHPDVEPEDLEHPCALRLAAGGPLTLEETGQRINLTRERVRQVETTALRRLRLPSDGL